MHQTEIALLQLPISYDVISYCEKITKSLPIASNATQLQKVPT